MKRRLALIALACLPLASLHAEEKPAAAADKVRLKTNQGDIVIELNRDKAPVTVENFLGYVKKKYYDGTVFHRVIDGFMIQGGGFTKTDSGLVEKTAGTPIKNEGQNGLKNLRGTISMARTNDPNSAKAQFFINVANNAALDYPNNGGYAVFGKVVQGMEIVDKIKAVPTGTARLSMLHPQTGEKLTVPAGDVPNEAVVIVSATAE
jgi:cyclophilin family peptidyl-prolyl cis-trans isomerase